LSDFWPLKTKSPVKHLPLLRGQLAMTVSIC
jgi:hypothetical protein